MGLKTWNDGEKAEIVQAIIESNFKVLGRYLSKYVLTLSTDERNLLSSDYVSDGLIVFDKTLGRWFEYKSGRWIKSAFGGGNNKVYLKDITSADWIENEIYIPYSEHDILNPMAQLFILEEDMYTPVIGGIYVDNDHGVTLRVDMPFDGKVVIK